MLSARRWAPFLNGKAWRSARTFEQVAGAVKMYVRNYLRLKLDIAKDVHARIEIPALGVSSRLWFVSFGDQKAVIRFYPLSELHDAERHRRILELLQENGVDAPALVDFQYDPEQCGAVILVEEFVEGEMTRPWNVSPDYLGKLAVQLGRLHGIYSDRWGSPGEPRSNDFFLSSLRGIERKLRRARKGGRLSGVEAREHSAWFRGFEEQFGKFPPYSLIHGDLHFANILYGAEGACHLVDYSRVEFATPAQDIAAVHFRVCASDPDRIRAFDAAYAAASPAEWERAQLLLPFYERLLRLGRVARGSGERGSQAVTESLRERDED
ncbi:MAG: aminoglycoside phosphotransferase family protein [Candidatus Sumerlaeaceae bacterium]|nr:aminoglycoside phosphotransferase family protein [Candidatus Sumerlaeaceae bacterium]